jgi:hypothetical protein
MSADPTNRSKVDYVPVELVKSEQPLFAVSEDDQVDVAVLQLAQNAFPNMSQYSVQPIPIRAFATAREIASVRPGDAIFTMGLVPQVSDAERNYPFLKMGVISTMPSEAVGAHCDRNSATKLLKIIYFASSIVQGNSGSPIVYFDRANPSMQRPALIGLESITVEEAGVAGMATAEQVFQVIRGLTKDYPEANLSRGAP